MLILSVIAGCYVTLQGVGLGALEHDEIKDAVYFLSSNGVQLKQGTQDLDEPEEYLLVFCAAPTDARATSRAVRDLGRKKS